MLGTRCLAQLYRSAEGAVRLGIPGDVVECGVASGGASVLMGIRLQQLGCDKRLFLFDTFEGLPAPTEGDPDYEEAVRHTGTCIGSEEDVRNLLKEHDLEERSVLVKGLFQDTLPGPMLDRIAVLHLDGDWYESIKVCLERLYPLLSPGAFVQIDDYFHWAGSRKAVDEFFSGSRSRPKFERVGDAIAFRKEV